MKTAKRPTTKKIGPYNIKQGRWQEIKYKKNGEAFITFRGSRVNLDNFLRTKIPDLPFLHGIFTLTAFSSYGVELSTCGGAVRCYYIYT